MANTQQAMWANNGDAFVVRRCDHCNGLVIEHWLSTDEGEFADFTAPEKVYQTIDVPKELVEWLQKAVRAAMME